MTVEAFKAAGDPKMFPEQIAEGLRPWQPLKVYIGGARDKPSPSADDLIAAHQQIIDRAHARGLKIFGATLTPFDGANYFAPEGEAKRQALNNWIRTSKAYDAFFDFDAATREERKFAMSELSAAYAAYRAQAGMFLPRPSALIAG